MSKVIAVMDKPTDCQQCAFGVCKYQLPLTSHRKGYLCQLLEPQDRVVQDFDYDEEVHLDNCPLKDCGTDIHVGSNNGWIPCSERLPDDCDNRFYMCIVENHEEDLPMFCQYEEDYGFGFWHDIYDEHTLGFVDSEFRTNEELGYEKVIAWQPLPPAYKVSSSEILNE